MIITLGITALLSLLASVTTVKADCNTPGWTSITPNPMQSTSGTITASTLNQLSAVPLSINSGDGLKYLSTDNNGVSSIGEYVPGATTWSVNPGYPYANFTDFFMFNYDIFGITCLLYVQPDGIYLATQDMGTKQWSTSTQVISGGFRWPRGTVVGQQVWIAAQDLSDYTISVIFADQLNGFVYRGPVSLSYQGKIQAFTPKGQFAMFTGDTASNPGLWFYWVNDLDSLPLLSSVIYYGSDHIQVAYPQYIGDIALFNTTSVSAVPKADGFQALLVRTGYLTKSASQPYASYTVVKIQNGGISQYCTEKTVKWNNNNNVVSKWAPALTADSISAGGVTMTWVDWSNGGSTGALNSLSGNVWN